MQFTIVGTSNSIMKAGWTRKARELWEATGDKCINLSIGGSSARYAAFLLHDQKALFQADRIIIESAINDQMFVSAGACSIDHCIASYAAILQRADAAGALGKLLILLFPRKVSAGGATSDTLISRLVAMFAHFGVDHLDLRPYLASWAAQDGMQGAATHADANHISPVYQDLIGSLVVAHLTCPVVPTDQQVSRRFALGRMRDIGLRRLTMTAADHIATKEVGSSIQRNRVYSIPSNYRFGLQGATYLVGAFVWTHAESGALIIGEGSAARRLNLRRSFRNIFLFDTFFQPVPLTVSEPVRVANDTGVQLLDVLGLENADLQIDGAGVEFVAFVGADADPLCLAEDIQIAMMNLQGLRRFAWFAMHRLHEHRALPLLRRVRRLFRAKLSSLRRK